MSAHLMAARPLPCEDARGGKGQQEQRQRVFQQTFSLEDWRNLAGIDEGKGQTRV